MAVQQPTLSISSPPFTEFHNFASSSYDELPSVTFSGTSDSIILKQSNVNEEDELILGLC